MQCEAVTDVDITAAAMLEQLDKELERWERERGKNPELDKLQQELDQREAELRRRELELRQRELDQRELAQRERELDE